jgi:L-threonylcarbamoyladenylate synthase
MMIVETRYWKVNPINPEPDIISKAATLLKNHELVAFPTETVYGLGALANSSPAVKKIFIAKNRPPQNPLLVHVSNIEQVKELVTEIPASARLLMEHFWPGPLSIILPARKEVPSIVRGGRSTVGLRMPSHPVALALIEEAGPIAAPSANLSGRPSPLNAQHVRADLDGKIAAVLDGGDTGIGLESTLVEFSNDTYRVLRLGGLPLKELQKVVGDRLVIIASNQIDELPHYQTTSRVLVCQNNQEFEKWQNYCLQEKKKFAIVYNNSLNHIISDLAPVYHLNLNKQGSDLYAILREAEQLGYEYLLFSPLPENLAEINPTLLDRIQKASAEIDTDNTGPSDTQSNTDI